MHPRSPGLLLSDLSVLSAPLLPASLVLLSVLSDLLLPASLVLLSAPLDLLLPASLVLLSVPLGLLLPASLVLLSVPLGLYVLEILPDLPVLQGLVVHVALLGRGSLWDPDTPWVRSVPSGQSDLPGDSCYSSIRCRFDY